MRDELEKLVAAGKIGKAHLEPLLQLLQSGYGMHRSWGFGKVGTLDVVFGRLAVDFPSKPGHSMDLAFAAESLRPIPADHILAQKASNLAGLREMAARHHLDLIRLVLASFGGRATADQIQQMLVPDVIADDWKKWWEMARREMRKDGHFQVPIKKSDPVVHQQKEIPLQERLMQEFRQAKGLKARLSVTAELVRNLADLSDLPGTAAEAIKLLNTEINSHLRTQPALALEAVFLRDELRAAAGVAAQEGEKTARDVWAEVTRPGALLEAVSAGKQKLALQSFRDAHPETWHASLLGFINNAPAKLVAECVALLVQEGKLDEFRETLARLISQHTAGSELLLWLAKGRSDAFADILRPEVFRAMLTAMERDQFNEKKANRLGDYIMSDQELLGELIESADVEVVKDLTRALQFSPSFDDMDKRSLLGRIVKIFPAIQSLISGDHVKQDATLVVSWESLERRKDEYAELVHKKIPANSKEIAIARSYGDLRENHEYKAAKEMHRLLMRRKAELEVQLTRARGTDFANSRTDVVSIGTRVTVTDLGTQQREEFALLGAWDSDPARGVISYLTPIAQALLNHAQGDELQFEFEGLTRRFRIESIAPAGLPAAAVLAPPVGEAASPPVEDPQPPAA